MMDWERVQHNERKAKFGSSKSLTTVCKEHPRYAARRQPRTVCEPCWKRWFEAERLRKREQWLDSPEGVAWLKQQEYAEWQRTDPDQIWINSPG